MRAQLAAALSLFAACAPIIESAPFPARPDTVIPGDLLGPYDGRVLDGDTEKPVAGALVVGVWRFERGVGFVGADGAITESTQSDNDGNYTLPRLKQLPSGLSTRLCAFTLIIYMKDYVGYRSDRRFKDGAPRGDFAQRGNRVRLERMSQEIAHARHLAFIGGLPEVRRAAAAEIEAASLELFGKKPTRPEKEAAQAPLDVWPLLRTDEVKATTGFAGTFTEDRLTDLPRTSFYDSHHFKAVGQPERMDVALRVWKLPPKDAQAQYERLLGALPSAKATDEIGARSLRAGQGDIIAVAWYDAPHGVVVQISCGLGQCPDHQTALKLAELIEKRLDMLGGPGSREGGEKPELLPPGQQVVPTPPEVTPPVPPPSEDKPFQLTPPGEKKKP
jgi:hypothetical protein